LNLNFKEQVPVQLDFQNNKIGEYYLDFVIDDKIALEIKQGERFLKNNIEQLYAYLKTAKLKLGILANFTPKGLQFKRIVNIYS